VNGQEAMLGTASIDFGFWILDCSLAFKIESVDSLDPDP
jgi:hypothetical protein